MPAPWMAGVCAGLAVHLGVSVALVRIIMICMTFVGLGFGVYLWLWVTVPEDSPERSGEGTLSPGLVRLREERAAQVSRNRLLVVGVALGHRADALINSLVTDRAPVEQVLTIRD